jgi:hypothetical protein
MGYSCPVCGDPQADARHLANHLAFTAVARGGDHEDWLDEHVPGWESMDEEGLAPEVVDLAEETEYPQVFEDTAEQHKHDHQHGGHSSREHGNGGGVPEDVGMADLPDEDELSAEAADAIERARELTRERHGSDADDES